MVIRVTGAGGIEKMVSALAHQKKYTGGSWELKD
jgi:hypothetical protein